MKRSNLPSILRHLLLFEVNALGDAVVFPPATTAIRDAFAKTRLTVGCASLGRQVFEGVSELAIFNIGITTMPQD